MPAIVITIIKEIITALLLLIAVLFLTSISRRAYNAWKYRRLDHLRRIFEKRIRESLDAGTMSSTRNEFIRRPKSGEWQAIEDVLMHLINEERYRDEAYKLFFTLGYVWFYEKHVDNGNVQVRAMSIDKLGKMKSEVPVPKLIALLDEKKPEIISVVVRSLSKIGGRTALEAIVESLPVILGRSLVTRKAMGMALQSFGTEAIPYLVAQKAGQDNLWVISCILDILSRLPADSRSVRLAAGYLSSTNAEVRSKALKVLGQAENVRMVQNLQELIIPLLQDPVWFVRLQAIRSIRVMGNEAAAPLIGKLIYDGNWQVRNEAAQALTALGERSLDIFLDIFTGSDRYAKDSICEEIEKTDYSSQLIKNLTAPDGDLQKKSRQVLEIMHSLGFSTPLNDYLEKEHDDAERELILSSILQTGSGK
jgi:HEAT repeat protein